MQPVLDSKEKTRAFPDDLARTYQGLTPKAFEIPVDMTTDPAFLQNLKAFIRDVYKVDENKWSYAVPSFDKEKQKEDAYLRQMTALIAQLTDLAGKINTAIRQEIVDCLQTHPLAAIQALKVPPVEQLIVFSGKKLLPSALEISLQAQPDAKPLLQRIQGLLKSAICTDRYSQFAERFGQPGAFIDNGPTFAHDREQFFRSTKMKLETIVYCYQQQYQDCQAPGVSAASKTATLSTIGDFLRELQTQALKCQDGMAFISEAYDRLTKKNNPAHWLLEFRTDITMAIVPGCELKTGQGDYQIHAQTTVEREAAQLGFGIKHLPYQDRYKSQAEVKQAMVYARTRLQLEFPFNYNYDTLCDVMVKKLRELVQETLRDYQGKIISAKPGQRDLYDELLIKLRNPPLNFSGLELEQILAEAPDGSYRLDPDLLNPEDLRWSLHFMQRAHTLLADLGVIDNDRLLPQIDAKDRDAKDKDKDKADSLLYAALVDAIQQRQLHRLYGLLAHPRAQSVVTPHLIALALDDKSATRQSLPTPQNIKESPYQRSDTWQPLVALQLLLQKLPDEALLPKKAADHLFIIGMQHASSVEFNLILQAVVQRLAPALPTTVPALSSLSFEEEKSRRLEDRVALLHKNASRLTAYANQLFPDSAAPSPDSSSATSLTALGASCIQFFNKTSLFKIFSLLQQVPQTNLPDDSGTWKSKAMPLIHQLRAITTTAEISNEHCMQSKRLIFPLEWRRGSLQIFYYQAGLGALCLFQVLAAPATTESDAEKRVTRLEHLLELARYVPVDLSAARMLRGPKVGMQEEPLRLTTPLLAALDAKDYPQFLQLLDLGADPTVLDFPTVLVLTASSACPDAVFAHLVQKIGAVFTGREAKASEFVNRLIPGTESRTVLRETLQHGQLQKLQLLLTHFKALDVSSVSSLGQRDGDSMCWAWVNLVLAVREQRYSEAATLLLQLYHSVQSKQLDPEVESSALSAEKRQFLLTEKNHRLLKEQAQLLLTTVLQQGGEHALPFLTMLAEPLTNIDLLLAIRDKTDASVVDFNAPRPGMPSFLHDAIGQERWSQVQALLKRNADPSRVVDGCSALLVAVSTPAAWPIVRPLLAYKPAILIDQSDASGKHLLCYAVESSCLPKHFNALVDRFSQQSDAKGTELNTHARSVLLTTVEHHFQDPHREANVDKLIKLLTLLDAAPVLAIKRDKRMDAVHSLLQCIQAARAKQWPMAIDCYLVYLWQRGMAVEDDLSPEFVAMLQHQGCEEFVAQLETQRTAPTGLLQVKAFLQGENEAEERVALALTQFMAWAADDKTSSAPRALSQSLRVLKHLYFPQGFNLGDATASPLATDFTMLCGGVVAQVSDRVELVHSIVSLMVEMDPNAAADSFMQWTTSMRHHNPEAALLSSLQSIKITNPNLYSTFLVSVVKQLGKLLPKDIHHYPELFAFILQEVTDLSTLLFTHSSDEHTVYYTPFTYALKAQLPEQCEDYVARHQRGEAVGMQAADSCGRTPLMLAAALPWKSKESLAPAAALSAAASAPAPVTTTTAAPETLSPAAPERKQAVVTPEEQRQREQKEQEAKAREIKEPEEKKREGKEREVKVKAALEDQTASSTVSALTSAASALAVVPPASVAPATTIPTITTTTALDASSSLPVPVLPAVNLLDSLLAMQSTDALYAVDHDGNHVLLHAVAGPVQNFEKIAKHLQQHLSREQWLALVRQTNKAGESILTKAVARQCPELIFSFLAMDIELPTFDLTPCQHMKTFSNFYALMQEIKRERDGYASIENRDQNRLYWKAHWHFTEFEKLWEELADEKKAQEVTVTALTHLFNVLAYDGGNYFHQKTKRSLDFYKDYFPMFLERHIAIMSPQMLLIVLRWCVKNKWLLHRDNRSIHPGCCAFKLGQEEVAAQLIRDEIERDKSKEEPSLDILESLFYRGTELIFQQATAIYLQYGGYQILNAGRILSTACWNPGVPVVMIRFLMTIPGIDLVGKSSGGQTAIELILEERNAQQEQLQQLQGAVKIKCETRIAELVELRDEFLTSETVLNYQYKKFRDLLKASEEITVEQFRLALLSLHHLVRLGKLDLDAELRAIAADTADKVKFGSFCELFFCCALSRYCQGDG